MSPSSFSSHKNWCPHCFINFPWNLCLLLISLWQLRFFISLDTLLMRHCHFFSCRTVVGFKITGTAWNHRSYRHTNISLGNILFSHSSLNPLSAESHYRNKMTYRALSVDLLHISLFFFSAPFHSNYFFLLLARNIEIRYVIARTALAV